MSPRLRWSVLLASVLLAGLYLPEALRLVHEEVQLPLLKQGRPLAAQTTSPQVPELVASRGLVPSATSAPPPGRPQD